MDKKMFEIYMKKINDIKIKKDERWAIYGTGNGAELIFSILVEMKLDSAVKYIIERDDKIHEKQKFHGIQVLKLLEVCDYVNGIIIAAMDNHEIIKMRIHNTLLEQQIIKIKLIDIFTYNTAEEKQKYAEYIEKSIIRKSEEFVPYDKEKYIMKEGDAKVIAWYLPQFHQIEINNKFHGQGFTEWTNTSKAIPMYVGHYQPHIPYDVGYYDLLNIDTFKRQIHLAKHYGVYGFCFHYYWFSGKRIMEKPIEIFLENKKLDMPFCLNWATENWTTLWEGKNDNIMLEQKLRDEDDIKFMCDILPYMKDQRYIKIDGRPVLIIYRVDIFGKKRVRKLFENFRNIAKKEGFPDLYIILTNSYGFDDNVIEWGADAIVEFPAHGIVSLTDSYRPRGYLNPYFNGIIRDVTSFIENKKYMLKHNSSKFFRSALTSWDNTARRATSHGMIFHGFTPDTFKKWMVDILEESKKIHSDSENIVFVNSWNEWAEGSHLEPDMKYGYAYLQALKDAILRK